MRFPPPGDPLVVGMRKVLAPVDRATDFSLTVPTIKSYESRTRRAGREFPAERATQTVINAVIVYKLLGMSVNEIAMTLNTEVKDVDHILSMPAFQDTFELMFHEILSVNSSSLQARIASYAGRAAENVMDLAEYKPTPKITTTDEGDEIEQEGDWKVPPIVVLKANQDILDRSGLSADTLFDKANQDSSSNTLQIEVISEENNRTQVNIKMGK